ncbi:ribonuclease HepT family protein [Thiobacillus sp.]
MLNASLLSIIEEAGIAVLTLTEGVEKDEFLASHLTRAETKRQIQIMSETAANLPSPTRSLLAEVDWGGWHTVAQQLGSRGDAEQDALWFAVRALVPATLMWLRVYRTNQPEMFECKPASAAGGESA